MEKKIRDIIFKLPIKVRQYLVALPALVADGLIVEVLLGAKWMKAVGACLNITRLKVIEYKKKLRLKKLPGPSEDFVMDKSKCIPVSMLRLLLVALLHKNCSLSCPLRQALLCE